MPARGQLALLAMQFLPGVSAALAGGYPPFAKEVSAGSRLPYLAQVDDHSVMLRDGSLMQVLHLGGLLFETADAGDLNYRKTLREAMLRAVGGSRHALYHHIIRRPVQLDGGGSFADPFSRSLDTVWQERLSTRRLYTNDLYVTLIRRPAHRGGGAWRRLASIWGKGLRASGVEAGEAAELRAIDAMMEQLMAALGKYSPARLGVYDTSQGPCSEVLEFLAQLYGGDLRPVRLPYGDVGEYLPDRRVSFGADTLELDAAGTFPAQLAAVLSIKDYAAVTSPGMLDDLLRIPAAMTISQSFAFVDRGEGLSRMNLALRRMRAADDEALSLRDQLAEAKDAVAAGRAAFGEHHMTVLLRASEQAAVDEAVAEAQSALADIGIIAVREDVGLEAAFWAQFPGNFPFIARRAMIGTSNFASFASWHNFPIGRARGNLWGDAVTTFETTAAGPYHFNFHASGGGADLGNFTVIGPSGSGKTVIVNFLLAQARRYAPRLVFFDKDRGAELFIRAIGGAYDVMRPGVATGLNPLAMVDSADNRRFLADWLTRLANPGGEPLTTPEQAQVEAALAANFAAPRRFRRLSTFVDLLRGAQRPVADDLHARLRPWWGDGEHAWLFDNATPEDDTDGLDLTRNTVGFDMTRLLDSPALRTPAMMYLFHRVDERLDGSPTIIVVDEGWKALDDPIFAQRIRDWEKTIRKKNGIIGFVTQNAEDALSSSIASAIVEQAATQIFTANPKAQEKDYIHGFGLTAHEFELVRSLPESTRCFLVKHGQESVVVRLNLAAEDDILTILSGQEASVRRLDAIRAELGDDPDVWLPVLLADASGRHA